jgi:hypothetical protein
MKIGIVILNWNGIALLKRYLPSVVAHSSGHVIYLADNASTDDSVQWTQDTYPAVHIIAMDKNRGYAGGYNVALQMVGEEIVCLLNSDVAVTPNWCDAVKKRFEIHPKLAACQPKIRNDKKKSYFEYAGAAGGFLDRFAYPYCRGRIFDVIEKDFGQYDDAIDIHWASGACLFLRKSSYDQIGGMDKDYFAHQEEIDLCWRLRHAGFTISYEPKSLVYHLGGGTLSHLSVSKTFYNFRNSLYNIVKNDHSNVWVWILFIRMWLDGIAGIKFLFEGKFSHFFTVFKAHFYFYSELSSLLNKRKDIKSFREVSKVNKSELSIVYQHFIKGRDTYEK